MEVKTREKRGFSLLCGLLILMACCFRTGAVLGEKAGELSGEAETYPYFREEGEGIYLWTGGNSAGDGQSQPGEDQESAGNQTTTGDQGSAGNRDASHSQGSRDTPGTGETQVGQGSASGSLSFSEEEIDNRWGGEVNIGALAEREVSFRVTDSPCVLIIHTHGSEAYGDQEGYRSENPGANVIRVGKEIADALNSAGISTIHDQRAYDLEVGYDNAYEAAAEAIADYLDKYPQIQMVIDVHRDGIPDGQGGQKALSANLRGQTGAAMMLVMGTDTAELPHENWEENLAFAMRLQSYIGQRAPEIMRKISLRGARYNEHFTPCSILLEVGSAGNTMEEALRSGRFFGETLAEFLKNPK